MISKPFQGIRRFCKASDNTNNYYVVLGLPVDGATTFRPGARFGPSAIREASMMLTDGSHPKYQIEIQNAVSDLGDVDLSVGNTSKMLEQIETSVGNVLSWGKHPIFLGGDHTITLGILRAMKKHYDSIAVIHFDAHCDTWSSNFDEPIGHGTWLFNAINENLVDSTKVISIGIRSPADSAAASFLENHGGTTITARQAMADINGLMDKIFAQIGNTPVYLSLDIDCLDPAHAPGTGTPEIGGLSTMWMMDWFDRVQELNWIGMDVVEVAPPYDNSGITALAAATFAWTYLSMLIHRRDVVYVDCGDRIAEDDSGVG